MNSGNIDLRRLRHAVVLAGCGSYIKAAKQLNLTQSALSRSIQSLEEDAGVRLFDRDRAGVSPTAVGRELVRRARELLNESNDLGRWLGSVGEAENAEAAFGMSPSVACAFLSELLTDVLNTRPDLRTTVAVRGAESLMSLLINDDIEFFVAADNQFQAPVPVDTQSLGRFQVALLVRQGHPLLEQDKPSIGDIEKYPLVSIGEIGSRLGLQVSESLRSRLSVRVITDDFATLTNLTRNTDAIWLTSTIGALSVIADNALVPLPQPRGARFASFELVVVSRRRRTLSPAAGILIDKLKTLVASKCRVE